MLAKGCGGGKRFSLKFFVLWELSAAYCSMHAYVQLSADQHKTHTIPSFSPFFPPRCITWVC